MNPPDLAKVSLAVLLISGCVSHQGSRPGTLPDDLDLSPFREVVLTVHGLSCPLCASNLDGLLEKIEGVEGVDLNLQSGEARVRLREGHAIRLRDLARAVDDAGFTLKSIRPAEPAP